MIGVDVEEVVSTKEVVHRHRHVVTDPGDCADGVGPWSDMGEGAQGVEVDALLLHRVPVVDLAEQGDAGGDQLNPLALGRALDQLTAHRDAGAVADLLDVRVVVLEGVLGDDLEVVEA